ncbi:uncharacterized protein LOC143462063 isoform X1 [Clavelina lepadiformis]|uniref:uncharacterized protein LOC143462063 isoform X1 n=1 Tax=Clavelina lepadiformis TaxID=159417 RepID=UPI0040413D99
MKPRQQSRDLIKLISKDVISLFGRRSHEEVVVVVEADIVEEVVEAVIVEEVVVVVVVVDMAADVEETDMEVEEEVEVVTRKISYRPSGYFHKHLEMSPRVTHIRSYVFDRDLNDEVVAAAATTMEADMTTIDCQLQYILSNSFEMFYIYFLPKQFGLASIVLSS